MIQTTIRKHTGWTDMVAHLQCDTCQSRDKVEAGTFKECIDLAMRDGWAVYRSEMNWNHICPLCNSNALEEQKKTFKDKVDLKAKYGLK